MKRTQTILFGFSLLSLSVAFGQTAPQKANTRDGEAVEYCHQHVKLNEMMSDPAFAAQYAIDQAILQQTEEELKTGEHPKSTVYKIPVVFHILHSGGIENITREQVLDAVAILNRDYRLLNADAATVHFDFNSSNPDAVCEPSDVEIEFVLATKAPNGACFSGITRTLSAMSYQGEDGGDQVQAIVSGNDVYQGQWAGNKYLNIFVCGDIGGAAGYTTNPSNWSGTSMTNGIWLLHNYTGSIGTGDVYRSRALTHEVGHWLNLSHTWGSNNNPAVACGSDGVADTPQTRGSTSCNLNENFCGPRANVENYMDYSYCSKMFTQGQVDRMRAAIVSSVGGRSNIWTPANLALTGADVEPTLCSAQFSAPRRSICVGETIDFHDETYNAATGWTWTFAGGTPANSTTQHPSVTYNTPGVYTVTLSATDGTSTDGETKTDYITVLPAGTSLPFFEGFENMANLTGSRWLVDNPGNNNKWEVTNTAGHTGTQSAKLANYGQPAENIDELISFPVDLSGVNSTDGVTLSFRYAYRKRNADNDDYLKVFLSSDCGQDWELRKTMHNSTLSNEVITSNWTPALADWETVHMTNVTASFWESNFRFKFRFESDGGNNIFIDDINIYAGDPSDNIVLGTDENELFQNVNLYPNPADEEVNLRFTVAAGQTVTVAVTDLMGNVIQHHTINANQGTNLVLLSTNELAAGMYLVRLNEGQTMSFVVK